jgi:hypothetical protein
MTHDPSHVWILKFGLLFDEQCLDLDIYPVRNNAPLLCSGDEDYSFFSEHGVQSPV